MVGHLKYIEDSIELIKSRATKSAIYGFTPIMKLMELNTIHVGGIRQSGKTETITELMRKYPSVYIGYLEDIYTYEIPEDLAVDTENIDNLRNIKLIPEIVFIDEASCVFNKIKPSKLYKRIYKAFGDNVIVVAMH